METRQCSQVEGEAIQVPRGARIELALYGNLRDPEQHLDVTSIVQEHLDRAEAGNTVTFKAYGEHENQLNSMFPNPLIWAKKTLLIKYTLAGKDKGPEEEEEDYVFITADDF